MNQNESNGLKESSECTKLKQNRENLITEMIQMDQMNHENVSNEAKLIIKMRQMDQNEWVEYAKIIQSQRNEVK